MYKDFTKLDLTMIEYGEKITLVKMSDFGFPLTIHMKFEASRLRDYAQYKNCLSIQGRQPRKRKSRVWTLNPNDDFVIYKGFVEMENTETSYIDEEGTKITQMGTCFDRTKLKKININNLEKIYSSYEL